jgi:hypothetical protein
VTSTLACAGGGWSDATCESSIGRTPRPRDDSTASADAATDHPSLGRGTALPLHLTCAGHHEMPSLSIGLRSRCGRSSRLHPDIGGLGQCDDRTALKAPADRPQHVVRYGAVGPSFPAAGSRQS